jgi:hypothetical protein
MSHDPSTPEPMPTDPTPSQGAQAGSSPEAGNVIETEGVELSPDGPDSVPNPDPESSSTLEQPTSIHPTPDQSEDESDSDQGPVASEPTAQAEAEASEPADTADVDVSDQHSEERPAATQTESPTPVRAGSPSSLDTLKNLLQTVAQVLQKFVSTVVPFVRAIAVLALRFVIQILQLLLDLLEGAWRSPSVPGRSANTASGEPAPVLNPTSQRVQMALRPVILIWNGIVTIIRAILPESWNQKLPTPLLNLILASIVALGLWSAPSLLFSRSAPAKSNPPDQTAPPQVTPPDQVAPPADQQIPPKSAPPINVREVPISLEPVILESGKEIFEPPVGIPPKQQKAITNLQKQLVDLRDRYSMMPLLIQAARLDLLRDRLTVELGEDWYALPANRQDRLAADLWGRSQQANLSKLLLVDAEGNVLARSPSVGSEMLILQRQPLLPLNAEADL